MRKDSVNDNEKMDFKTWQPSQISSNRQHTSSLRHLGYKLRELFFYKKSCRCIDIQGISKIVAQIQCVYLRHKTSWNLTLFSHVLRFPGGTALWRLCGFRFCDEKLKADTKDPLGHFFQGASDIQLPSFLWPSLAKFDSIF